MTTQQPLGEIAEIVRGISFPKEAKSLEPRSGDVACLRTTNVQRVVEWDDLWFVPSEHVKRTEQFVQPGDILISTANSYELVGKVALVSAVPRQATLGAFISLIRARPGVDPRFLYHQLAWGRTQSRIRETASTTTNISNVSTKKLAALQLDVPPLYDQRRIVAELEKQFSRIDEAVVNLKRVKANLKRYKAAVLKAAVEGRLVPTESERARREGRDFETGEQLLLRILEARRSQWTGKGKYKAPIAPSRDDTLPPLPDGWTWASVDQLLANVTDGD
ncbi:MAG: restriction endonuclease subunit S, partial [Pseudomonadota bacterium]